MCEELCLIALFVLALLFGVLPVLCYRLGLRDGLWQSGKMIAPLWVRAKSKVSQDEKLKSTIAKRVEEF